MCMCELKLFVWDVVCVMVCVCGRGMCMVESAWYECEGNIERLLENRKQFTIEEYRALWGKSPPTESLMYHTYIYGKFCWGFPQ